MRPHRPHLGRSPSSSSSCRLAVDWPGGVANRRVFPLLRPVFSERFDCPCRKPDPRPRSDGAKLAQLFALFKAAVAHRPPRLLRLLLDLAPLPRSRISLKRVGDMPIGLRIIQSDVAASG